MAALGQGRSEWLIGLLDHDPSAALLTSTTSLVRGRFLDRPAERLLEGLCYRALPIVSAFGGPLALNGRVGAAELARIILAGAERAESGKALLYRGFLDPSQPEDIQAETARIISSAGLAVGRWATIIVGLEPDLDRVMASFSATTRKKIRRAGRMGLTVRPLTGAETEAYTRLLDEAHRRLGLRGGHWHLKYRDRIEAAAPDVFEFFGCFNDEGRLVASGGVALWAGTATSIALFQGDRAERDRLPAVYLLHWEIIRWAIERGARWYDLGGVDPDPAPKSKAAGIRFFKERWGGSYHEYVTFERDFDRPLGRMLARLRPAIGGPRPIYPLSRSRGRRRG